MDPKVVFDRPLENLLDERLAELEANRSWIHVIIASCFLFIGIIGIWLHGLNVSRLIKLNLIFPPGLVTLHFQLALANLGVVAAFFVGATATFYNRWIFGSIGCQIYAFEGMVCGMATIALTCSICFLQWLEVRCGVSLSTRNYRLVAILSWISSVFWAILPLFGFGNYTLEPHKTTCSLDLISSEPKSKGYLITLTMLGYVIPVFLAVLAYFYVVKRYCGEVQKNTSQNEKPSKKLEKFELEVKLNGCILVNNILTWLALGITACWGFAFGLSDFDPRVFYIPQLLVKLGCALAPVSYLITMRRLQRYKTDEMSTKHE